SDNKLLSDAVRDLEYFRHFGLRFTIPDPSPSYVSGTIVKRESDLSRFVTPTWPLRGAEVRARGKDFEAKAVTGHYGQFEFSGLPAGDYEIAVGASGRYQEMTFPKTASDSKTSFHLNIRPDSCVRVAFLNVSKAVLKGRLLDSDGILTSRAI